MAIRRFGSSPACSYLDEMLRRCASRASSAQIEAPGREKMLQLNKLEHVLIEKVRNFSEHALADLDIRRLGVLQAAISEMPPFLRQIFEAVLRHQGKERIAVLARLGRNRRIIRR